MSILIHIVENRSLIAMIVSRPKRSTLISLSLFLIIVLGLILATINSISLSAETYWYHYLFLLILIPSFVIVLVKVIVSYKIIRVGNNTISLAIPVRFLKKEFSLKDIEFWKEVKIKTASGLYQQLEINFVTNDKITLGKQEHSNYNKIISYLQRKAGKKKKI